MGEEGGRLPGAQGRAANGLMGRDKNWEEKRDWIKGHLHYAQLYTSVKQTGLETFAPNRHQARGFSNRTGFPGLESTAGTWLDLGSVPSTPLGVAQNQNKTRGFLFLWRVEANQPTVHSSDLWAGKPGVTRRGTEATSGERRC